MSEVARLQEELERTRLELEAAREELRQQRSEKKEAIKAKEVCAVTAAAEVERARAELQRTRSRHMREMIESEQAHMRDLSSLQRASSSHVAGTSASAHASPHKGPPSRPRHSSDQSRSQEMAPGALGTVYTLPLDARAVHQEGHRAPPPPPAPAPGVRDRPAGLNPAAAAFTFVPGGGFRTDRGGDGGPTAEQARSIGSDRNTTLDVGFMAGPAPRKDDGGLRSAAGEQRPGTPGSDRHEGQLEFERVAFPSQDSAAASAMASPAKHPALGGGAALNGAPPDGAALVEAALAAREAGTVHRVGGPDGSDGGDGGECQGTGIGARGRYCLDDFEIMCVLGQGAFGKVFQVRKRDDGKVFAMKVMQKDRVLEKGHEGYITNERAILTQVVHPYVVTLQGSFQTPGKLYLIMDFVNGGHLFFQLKKVGTFDEDLARLYTAELVLALGHLHAMDIVHRDLKPENILLDYEGHIRVTDFGLAKPIGAGQRSNSLIGTMEYMAPEVINASGHGKEIDWWSLGVLLFEMLTGSPPFEAASDETLKRRILTAKLSIPKFIGKNARSILNGLLNRQPEKRLGYGETGAEDVMAHPFFAGVKWDDLRARKVRSPFTPTVSSSLSTENFGREFTSLPAHDSPGTTPRDKDGKSLMERHVGTDPFAGFSYWSHGFLAQTMEARGDGDGQ